MSHYVVHPARQALRGYISVPLLVCSAPLEGIIATEQILTNFVQNVTMKISAGHVPRINIGPRPCHQEGCSRAGRQLTLFRKTGVRGVIARSERRARYRRRIRIS